MIPLHAECQLPIFQDEEKRDEKEEKMETEAEEEKDKTKADDEKQEKTARTVKPI